MHYQLRRAAAEVPALVFINSLGTDFRIWREVVDMLAATSPTLPTTSAAMACRASAAAPYSMDDHVDDLAGLLDRLGIDDVDALRAVRRRPDRAGASWRAGRSWFAALILCDTAAQDRHAPRPGTRASTPSSATGIEAIADCVMENWFTPAFHRGQAG